MRRSSILRAAIIAVALLSTLSNDILAVSGPSTVSLSTPAAQTTAIAAESKILVLGDSISIGCCAPENLTWFRIFAQRLDAQVENLARGATTTKSLIHTLRSWPSGRTQSQLDEAISLLAELKAVPAITITVGIVEFAVLDPDTGETCFTSESSACKERFAAAFESVQTNLHFIFSELQNAMPPGTQLLMLNDYFGGPDWKLNTIISSEAQEHGVQYVNLSVYFQNRRDELIVDWIHKNEAGHRVIADVLTNAMPPDTDGDGLSNLMEGLLNSDPDNPDSDGDGCLDGVEFGPKQGTGGRRDPTNFWDLFHVWTGPTPVRDHIVSVADITAVVSRFGSFQQPPPTQAEALAQALTPPESSTGYHAAYDRGGSFGPNVWNVRPPDGAITGADIAAIVFQFGHRCT